jgi:murein L,D-transpeptidase YcbB/YkuD
MTVIVRFRRNAFFAACCFIWALGTTPAAASELAGALMTDDQSLQRLGQAVANYRDIASRDGWPDFADGRTLHPGETDRRVPALARILSLTGDLAAPEAAAPEIYTAGLSEAVRRFQRRHGLNPDAVIGRNTSAALAVSAADRARTLERNLDRLHALQRRLPPYAIVVNIPAFALTILSNGRAEWQTRVIVGRPSWRTPSFESAITRIELNPYWNVPPSIARRELVPKIAADPGYLARHDMKVLSGFGDAAVEPDSVDWRRFGASGYRLRQDPGPANPLGQVKFNLPNPYNVYLHDTPTKGLFDREMRALSHGCVRVENAMELAARFLRAEPGWSEERLAAEVATGRNIQIPLTRSIPVALVYVTAWVDPQGTVQFRPDLYGRDARDRIAGHRESCSSAAMIG